MILTKDHNHGDYEINSYEPGKLKINQKLYAESIVLSSNRLELWLPTSIQDLTASNFDLIVSLQPDIVLLGTGKQLIFPASAMLQVFYKEHIGIEIMGTLAACRTFNVLMSEGRNVVAALLIR